MCVVVEGSMGAELPGGGVAWAFMGVVVVVVGTGVQDRVSMD